MILLRQWLCRALFVLCLFWPLVHIFLSRGLGLFSPWRFFGWGMYAAPHPVRGQFLLVERPDGQGADLRSSGPLLVLENFPEGFEVSLDRNEVRDFLTFPSQESANRLAKQFPESAAQSPLILHVVYKRYDRSTDRLYHTRKSYQVMAN